MYIKKLALTDFRNFAQVDEISFPPGALLVAAAPNATGKTNFLEALTVLLRAKSFRGGLDDCVHWGKEAFLLKGEISHQQGSTEVAVRYDLNGRKVRIEENGLPASPITFFGRYPLVVFLPEDTFLFGRGPSQRRSLLNQILISSPIYLSALVQYHRALKQRNALLKTAVSPEDLTAWTDLLVEHGTVMWSFRESFVQFITSHLAELYESITGERRQFGVRLLTPLTADAYRASLTSSFSQEKRYGYTLYGPHRDDIEVTTHERLLTATLSRGQLRSVVIALKLAAHRFLKQTTKEEPLLLLDEVLSELDETRQTSLLNHLPKSQVLLTCTAVPAILAQRSEVHLLDLRSIIDTMEPTTVIEAPVQDIARQAVAAST